MYPASCPVHRPGKYAGYWTIKKFRRWLRNTASRLLARDAEAPALEPLDPAAVHRVIVCRRNSRLGNMLFLTPLLRALHAALPQAEIDLLIGSRDYGDLFRGLPGVRHVWVMPRRGWLWPWRMLVMLFQLRGQHYDLSVEPSVHSFSNRLSARLCSARWRLGFHTPSQWLSLTHPVTPTNRLDRHEALRPLQLVSAGIAGAPPVPRRLHVELSPQESAAGASRLASQLANHAGHGPVIGFFTEATGKKRLPTEWWQAWIAGLRAHGQPLRLVQLLPPGAAAPIEPGLAHIRESDHRRLAAMLGALDLFVSCDTGPMHLAEAVGTPTIGLFHASKNYRYRPLGESSLALEVGGLTPQQAAQAVLRHFQQSSSALRDTVRHGREARNAQLSSGSIQDPIHQQAHVPADYA